MRFKYNIGHYTSLLPDHIYLKDVVNQLAEHGISEAEYLRDKRIAEGSEDVVPEERLVVYASVLGVSVEDLKG